MGETPRTPHDPATASTLHDPEALAFDPLPALEAHQYPAAEDCIECGEPWPCPTWMLARRVWLDEQAAGGVGEALPDTPPPDELDCSWCDGTGKTRLNIAHGSEWMWASICSAHRPNDPAAHECEQCNFGSWVLRGSGVAPQPPDAEPSDRHVLVGDLGWLEYAIADYIAKWGEHLTGEPYMGEFGPNIAGMPTAVANMAMTVIRKNLAGLAAAPLPDTAAPEDVFRFVLDTVDAEQMAMVYADRDGFYSGIPYETVACSDSTADLDTLGSLSFSRDAWRRIGSPSAVEVTVRAAAGGVGEALPDTPPHDRTITPSRERPPRPTASLPSAGSSPLCSRCGGAGGSFDRDGSWTGCATCGGGGVSDPHALYGRAAKDDAPPEPLAEIVAAIRADAATSNTFAPFLLTNYADRIERSARGSGVAPQPPDGALHALVISDELRAFLEELVENLDDDAAAFARHGADHIAEKVAAASVELALLLRRAAAPLPDTAAPDDDLHALAESWRAAASSSSQRAAVITFTTCADQLDEELAARGVLTASTADHIKYGAPLPDTAAPEVELATAEANDLCPSSRRVDGPKHSWRFDGDDPYVICVFCDEMRDALTGRVIRAGGSAGTPGDTA